MRDPEILTKVADECVSRCGLPHIVVNNAAGNFISPTERLSPNAFRTIVDIVLNGTAIVTLEWGKRFINAKQGHSDFVSRPAFIGVQAIKAGRGSLIPSPLILLMNDLGTRLGGRAGNKTRFYWKCYMYQPSQALPVSKQRELKLSLHKPCSQCLKNLEC